MKLFLAVLLSVARALYFEINERDKKCFIEELPDDTQMIGKYLVQVFDKNEKVEKFIFEKKIWKRLSDVEGIGTRLRHACRSPRSKRETSHVPGLWFNWPGKFNFEGKSISTMFSSPLLHMHLANIVSVWCRTRLTGAGAGASFEFTWIFRYSNTPYCQEEIRRLIQL